MYEKVMKHFRDLASIPHCSFETSSLALHVKEHGKKCGFEVKEDSVGNILCKKGKPKICLQSHYDMVCMGKAPELALYEDDGWLKAKDSSLGADNGMGVAIMLAMMEKHENLECLFTNDEEVGLLGAEGLELEIESKNLLNLDSEEEDEVVIGCASGVDIFGEIEDTKEEFSENQKAYEVSIDGLDGGHSGIDIAKNIPNAIKVLTSVLIENDCKLVSIRGGERINSIPKSAKAVVFSSKKIEHEGLHVKEIACKDKAYKHSKNILHAINAFSQGVRAYDEDLKMPITSINLSIIKEEDGKVVLEFFARSMQDIELERVKSETKSLLCGFGFDVSFKRQTSSWQPVKSPFALHVKSISSKYIKNVKLHAVHAGLECGVILKKQPSIKGVCSIGPTIENPHSTRERCLLSSVEKITQVVNEILSENKEI